jgi:type I restriction enzyme S subunit
MTTLWLQSREKCGLGTPGISQPLSSLKQFRVPLPVLNEQVAGAELLAALDDKIELNRRMNETLEAMAWAIFRDWFVDFGPTRAKQEGREPYLAPEIWSPFPAHLDDEGKPEG